jgi:hypothetical protein
MVQLYIERGHARLTLPDRDPPRDLVEARTQDLADLALLPRFDRSFTAAAKAEFDRQLQALSARAAELDDAAFSLAVARLVALPGNGHTGVDLNQRAARFNRVPLRFAWFAEGLYVVRARPEVADLLGARIAAIDGRSPDAALAAVRPFLSGADERARATATPLLESPELLQVLWPDAEGQALELLLVAKDGATIQRHIQAAPPGWDSMAAQPVRAITPQQGEGWMTVLQAAPRIPLSLQMPERVALAAPLGVGRLYVRINANRDDDRGRLADQLAAIARQRPPAGWERIVVDLRFNEGGDERKTAAFTRDLPTLLGARGDVWVLTGDATFSAAIITAARIRHFLGPRARIAGGPQGDGPRFWSDGGAPLILRNSGIAIAHAWFLQDWRDGCRNPWLCMPNQWIYGVSAGRLDPDLPVAWRFADYAAGLDTVLERVLAEP